MNKLIEKLAHKVKAGEEHNYAVVVTDGVNRHGLFDISDDDKLQDSINKLAISKDKLPVEICAVAMGVINTVYMSKTGKEWPLFINMPPLETNLIDSRDINWTSFELAQKTADEVGFLYHDKFLPLDSKANIKAACSLLETYATRFDGKTRVKFANAICKEAKKLGVEVNGAVDKYATGTLNPQFYDLMDERIKIAQDYPETVEVLKQIMEDAAVMKTEKVADAMVVVDMMLPFSMKFGGKAGVFGSDRPMFFSKIAVPDAYNTVFGFSERPLTFSERVALIDDEKLGAIFSDVFIKKLREDPETMVKNAAPQVRTALMEMV